MEGFNETTNTTCRVNENVSALVGESCCTTTATTTDNCCKTNAGVDNDNGASNMSMLPEETRTTTTINIMAEKEEKELQPSGCGKEVTGLTHECGVFGAIACGDWPTQIEIAHVICLGIVALQHRGQESAGIVTSEGKSSKAFNVHKGMGMINNLFNEDSMKKLKGNLGIGHTRYSTSGGSEVVNCQPFVVHTTHGAMALAHNGDLVNSESLRREVLGRGVGLSTHSDSELIAQSLCCCPEGVSEDDGPNWPARIRHFMQLAHLSYSLVIMIKDKIYAVHYQAQKSNKLTANCKKFQIFFLPP